MIFYKSIPEYEYSRALHLLRRDNPTAAWGLTFRPEGDKYLLPEHNVYVCLKAMHNCTVEVTGAFRLGEGKAGACAAIVDLCRTLGYSTMVLDCFIPVADAWRRAGLVEYAIEPWKSEYAPGLWLPEYGTPSVVYMRKHFGG
jgi:hypothetical protein